MLVNTPTVDYGQIGWIEFAGSTRYTSQQIGFNNGAAGYQTWLQSPDAINSVSQYRTLYDNSSTGYMSFWDGSTRKLATMDEIFPNQVQVYLELHTQAPQVPGGCNNNNYVYNGSIYYPAGSGAWHTLDGTTNNTAPFGRESPPSGTSGVYAFNTWDTACAN